MPELMLISMLIRGFNSVDFIMLCACHVFRKSTKINQDGVDCKQSISSVMLMGFES